MISAIDQEVRILIVTPKAGQIATGNRCSAEQWVKVFRDLGHEVGVKGVGDRMREGYDVLVALNARRIPGVIEEFKDENPDGRVVVVLTGTDIYPEVGDQALVTMRSADRLVALQSKALERVPDGMREKTRVIVQSASPIEMSREGEFFEVTVVGHFRKVKDPLRTAKAVRLLPSASKVRVRQVGGILEERYEVLIREEVAENGRYECLGEVKPKEAGELIAGSDLLVLSSHSEGAGRVIGEAIACGTPVLSTRIDGVMGLLGEDYPGYFPVGDTEALAGLIGRAESDEDFYQELKTACAEVASLFSPETEEKAWQKMLDELTEEQSS